MTNSINKYSRRTIALFWFLVFGLIIGVLIYIEQIALLYVLATLGLVLLLLIVGFSDLEKIGKSAAEGFAGKKE